MTSGAFSHVKNLIVLMRSGLVVTKKVALASPVAAGPGLWTETIYSQSWPHFSSASLDVVSFLTLVGFQPSSRQCQNVSILGFHLRLQVGLVVTTLYSKIQSGIRSRPPCWGFSCTK